MYTMEDYDRLLGPRGTPAEQTDLTTASHDQQEEDTLQDNTDSKSVGVEFVQGLVQHLGLDGVTIPGGWPSRILKLYRVYKEAGCTFAKNLYDASSDLFPADAFYEMARKRWYLWEDDEESEELWIGVDFLHSGCIEVLADAVAIRSSAARVHPEMMLALMTEWVARWYVDDWYRQNRREGSWDATEHRIGDNHGDFTARLSKVLEILQPEYERWWEGGRASLLGVVEEIERINAGDYE